MMSDGRWIYKIPVIIDIIILAILVATDKVKEYVWLLAMLGWIITVTFIYYIFLYPSEQEYREQDDRSH